MEKEGTVETEKQKQNKKLWLRGTARQVRAACLTVLGHISNVIIIKPRLAYLQPRGTLSLELTLLSLVADSVPECAESPAHKSSTPLMPPALVSSELSSKSARQVEF